MIRETLASWGRGRALRHSLYQTASALRAETASWKRPYHAAREARVMATKTHPRSLNQKCGLALRADSSTHGGSARWAGELCVSDRDTALAPVWSAGAGAALPAWPLRSALPGPTATPGGAFFREAAGIRRADCPNVAAEVAIMLAGRPSPEASLGWAPLSDRTVLVRLRDGITESPSTKWPLNEEQYPQKGRIAPILCTCVT
jgi:hypothetical protein